MIKIAPSILTANFLTLGTEIKNVEHAGVDYIHLDIMDGNFVPNISFGPIIVEHIRKQTTLILDVHLMILNPEKYIDAFAKAGADIITVHYEACIHLHRVIQQIKNAGCKVGVAINPATNVDVLENILLDIDLALLMSVNPGFGGQQFIPQAINKIRKLKQYTDKINPNIEIEIDGGVNDTNINSIYQAGADIVVAGSSVFNNQNINDNIFKLRKAIK